MTTTRAITPRQTPATDKEPTREIKPCFLFALKYLRAMENSKPKFGLNIFFPKIIIQKMVSYEGIK
jgi:hypothetical protein